LSYGLILSAKMILMAIESTQSQPRNFHYVSLYYCYHCIWKENTLIQLSWKTM